MPKTSRSKTTAALKTDETTSLHWWSSLRINSAQSDRSHLLELPVDHAEPCNMDLLPDEGLAEAATCLGTTVVTSKAIDVGGLVLFACRRWTYPFRLAEATLYPTVVSGTAYETLMSLRSLFGNLHVTAELAGMKLLPVVIIEGPSTASSPPPAFVRLRFSVPANSHVRAQSIITVRVFIHGSGSEPLFITIPASGHFHSATCNHASSPKGAVFAAAASGDIPALEAALDAGGSTEEAAEVGVPIRFNSRGVIR